MTSRLRLKTRALTPIVILLNVCGNFFLSMGLKHDAAALGASPLDYIRVLLNPWVTGGVCLLILWLFSRMTLLSWADLSYVLPVTAVGYVLTAIVGWGFLGEHISAGRWAGTLLIVAGTALVGSTAVRTTGAPQARREEPAPVEELR